MDRKIIEKILFIRRFEEKIIEIYHTDVVKSPVHLCIGQELFSVLLAGNIQKEDKVIGNFRSHALSLALTNKPQSIADELFAKATGEFGGRGGSMHLGCNDMGMPWTSAIVASGIPIAVGMAEAQKRLNYLDNKKRIVICQFGDGAMEEGVFTESINYASLKNLPILFACEDNGLAIHSERDARTPNTPYAERISAYGIDVSSYSYEDPNELSRGVDLAVEKVRENKVHFLIVKCFRWMEHVGVGFDWDLGYREEKELNYWKNFDLETRPELWGFSENDIKEIDINVKEEIDYIFKKAYNQRDTEEDTIFNNVY